MVLLDIFGEINPSHPTAANFAENPVAITENFANQLVLLELR
jgi:hypothetical protein